MNSTTSNGVKHIVCIGGGNGMPRVLAALKPHDVYLSAIVTMADDGGSAGILREEYGGLPPGDVRRALVALSDADQALKDLFLYRFQEGGLKNHVVGNIMLKALELKHGSFLQAIKEARKVLQVKGDVIPVTLDSVRLCATFKNGLSVQNEKEISAPEHQAMPIEKIWLEPQPTPNPKALEVIANADLIIIGPGGLYHSVIANLLVPGIAEAIHAASAKKIYIANSKNVIQGFEPEDYVNEIKKHVPVDHVVLPTPEIIDAATGQHDAGEKLARVLLALL